MKILTTDNEKLYIEIKKNDFASDTDLSKQEIQDKYMSITGAYEIIE